jgi:hypothetical protein
MLAGRNGLDVLRDRAEELDMSEHRRMVLEHFSGTLCTTNLESLVFWARLMWKSGVSSSFWKSGVSTSFLPEKTNWHRAKKLGKGESLQPWNLSQEPCG